MAKYARFLWGWSKVDKVKVMDYIDFAPQDSAPTAVAGRLYMDDSYTFHKCMDGTSFATIFDMVPTTNPPTLKAGRVWLNSSYRIVISEDGSNWKILDRS